MGLRQAGGRIKFAIATLIVVPDLGNSGILESWNVDRKATRRAALREAGIPVVMRIDPLFPRSPLPCLPSRQEEFGLEEARPFR